MAISRAGKIEAAINSIKDFYAIGRASCDARPGRSHYRSQQLEGEAEEQYLEPFIFRKARQFASEYSRKDLNALCKLIREQKRFKTVFGRTHLIRLLAVPKSERGTWEKEAIKKGWPVSRLNAEMKVTLGRRRAGGKMPVVPRDARGIFQKLEDKCLEWARLRQGLSDRMVKTPKNIRDSIDASSMK